MTDEQTYAPRPGEITKVAVFSRSGKKVSTYGSLIEAVTAIYRLDPELRVAIETAVLMATAGGDDE